MSTLAQPSYRIRRTNLAWRVPSTSAPAPTPAGKPASAGGRSPIGAAYAESAPVASPAKALFAAFAASVALFFIVGALALPAAAFA